MLAVSGGVMIIGFAGKKQVGKSTAAGVWAAAGFMRASFAGPMKEVAEHLLMCAGMSSHDVRFFERHKEEPMPIVGVTMRHFLQTLGTDWGRKLIHSDLWVMAAAARIESMLSEGQDLVFEDVRFENEAAFIRERGGLIVHIERKTGAVDPHESEIGIGVAFGDATIHNSYLTVDGLRAVVLGLAGVDG
jgi:hypothetical protein